MKILVLPDSQVRPGVPLSHFKALSNYIAEKQPGAIVNLGDHFDMPSLSSYSLAGEREGQRYTEDIQAGKHAMDLLFAYEKVNKKYRPQKHFLLGNHEDRIRRTINDSPRLQGVISNQDLALERHWRVHTFLSVLRVAGVQFSHYFTSGVMGRPCGSAQVMLKERQGSCVQGHVQKIDIAIHPRTQQTALMAGVFYQHDESYLGPQGNDCKRGIWMLHEVHDGKFDLMYVSIGYLLRRYL
jgi:hypothetical protein